MRKLYFTIRNDFVYHENMTKSWKLDFIVKHDYIMKIWG